MKIHTPCMRVCGLFVGAACALGNAGCGSIGHDREIRIDGVLAGDLDSSGTNENLGDPRHQGDVPSPPSIGGDAGPGDAGCFGDTCGGDLPAAGDFSCGDGLGYGDSIAAGDGLEPGDARLNGDALAAGDEDVSPPARQCWYRATSGSVPVELGVTESRCVATTAILTLSGPASEGWRLFLEDALGFALTPIPEDGPGELVAEYLGSGEYSREGYAMVTGAEIPAEAAVVTIDIDGEQWVLTNTCAAPLLHVWVYAGGLDGEASEVAPGGEVCPAAAVWTLAVEAPLASTYDVAIFDFGDGGATYYDEVTLPQDANGLVVMPELPASGRMEASLSGGEGQEVESVSVYLDCP